MHLVGFKISWILAQSDFFLAVLSTMYVKLCDFTGVQNNQIDLFEFYNFNSLGCKSDISNFRLSLFVLTAKTLPKNQRLKAQGMRRKEKHFNGDNSTFCLAPCA
jgi:hypothetical protein